MGRWRSRKGLMGCVTRDEKKKWLLCACEA